MRARRIAGGYAVLMAACAVWFLWRPTSHVTVATIAAMSAGAVVVGVRLHHPRHAGSWLMLAAAIHVAAAVRRNPSVVLFVTGLLGLAVFDVLFRVGRIQGQRWTGTAIDVPWLVFSPGSAARHWSAR